MQTASQHDTAAYHHSAIPFSLTPYPNGIHSVDKRNQPNPKSFGKTVAKHYNVRKPPHFYSLGTKLGNKLHTRLRLKTSELNAHLFRIGLTQSPQCRCGYKKEGSRHFILLCESFIPFKYNLTESYARVYKCGQFFESGHAFKRLIAD